MQKYLSIPVKNEDNQLVLINEVAIVEQTSTTAVDIHYTSGQKPSVQVSLSGITDAGGAVPEISGISFS